MSWKKRLTVSIVAGVGAIGLATTVAPQLVDPAEAEVVTHASSAAARTDSAPVEVETPVVPVVAPEAPVAAAEAAEAPVAAPVAASVDTPSAAPAPAVVAPARAQSAAPSLAATSAPAPVIAAPPPPPAPAPATIEEKGAAALALINYPWQRLGYSVSFQPENPGLLGKANCGTREIFVYVRPTQTIRQIAFVTAFELGHAVDCGFMTDAERAEWAGIRGFPAGWTWFPGCLCTEDNFGSGDISMVFATWLVPDGGYRWRSNLAPPPPAEQLDRLMPYLRPVG